MSHFVGLDVSQKMTAICVVDKDGRRVWRGQCPSVPEQISAALRRYAGDNARIGIETGAMTPWIVHELRNLGLEIAHHRGVDTGSGRRSSPLAILTPIRNANTTFEVKNGIRWAAFCAVAGGFAADSALRASN